MYIDEKVSAATKQSSKDVDGKLRRRRRIRSGHREIYSHTIYTQIARVVGMARIANHQSVRIVYEGPYRVSRRKTCNEERGVLCVFHIRETGKHPHNAHSTSKHIARTLLRSWVLAIANTRHSGPKSRVEDVSTGGGLGRFWIANARSKRASIREVSIF